MRKTIAVFLAIVILVACSKTKEPEFIGYLIKNKEDILLVEGEESDIEEIKQMQQSEIVQNYQTSILRVKPSAINKIKNGVRVHVWADHILESYPVQIEVRHIEEAKN